MVPDHLTGHGGAEEAAGGRGRQQHCLQFLGKVVVDPCHLVFPVVIGAGQLGIEALSRGASHAVFVEQRPDAVALIHENLKVTELSRLGEVVRGDSLHYLTTAGKKFDVIFLDPPYHGDLLEKAVEMILKFDILSQYGIMVCESDLHKELPETLGEEISSKVYRYGKIKLTVYRRRGGEGA